MRVVVERSGGFAGVVVRGEADTARLDPEQAQLLRELAGRVDFASLEQGGAGAGAGRGAGAERRGADRFRYDVEVDAGGRSHRLRLGEGAVPAELRPLLDHVLRRP